MNPASKIGEDIGDPGEILVTAAAFEKIPATAGLRGDKQEVVISGLPVEVYSIKI